MVKIYWVEQYVIIFCVPRWIFIQNTELKYAVSD
nr:MAG TPA: hypothetical protein [Caudoviricetes sp.]